MELLDTQINTSQTLTLLRSKVSPAFEPDFTKDFPAHGGEVVR